ncbi:MFS transporter [Klebsiella pneumoniae subsp. pneumoniae]|nr:MFS transporter [Klebsiella pneumoniae subsp. pneumoniae]
MSLFDFPLPVRLVVDHGFLRYLDHQHLGISATKTGLLYSVNALSLLLMQPFFGFISDKFGLKKRLIWLLVALPPAGGPLLYLRLRAAAGAQLLVWRLAGKDLSGDHL